jgi:hypothetical protein
MSGKAPVTHRAWAAIRRSRCRALHQPGPVAKLVPDSLGKSCNQINAERDELPESADWRRTRPRTWAPEGNNKEKKTCLF